MPAVRARPRPRSCGPPRDVAEGRADGDGQPRLDRGDDGRGDLRPAAAARACSARRSRCSCRCPASRCSSSTSAPTSRCAPSTWSSSPSSAPPSARPCSASRAPAVGLLSVGEEAGKGREEVVAAHALLAGAPGIEFVGNVEGRDLPAGGADVVVTDGFTGNVSLKLMEGTARTVTGAIRDAARSNPLAAARRAADAPGARRPAPRARPRRDRRRDPARPARGRRRRPRQRRRRGDRQRGAARRPLRSRSTRSGAPPALLREGGAGRGALAGGRRERRVIGQSAMNRDEVLTLVRDHLAEELEVDAGQDRRGDPLQGGPRRRLPRPLRAGDGARGPLRRSRSPRSRRRGSRPSATPSTSSSSTPRLERWPEPSRELRGTGGADRGAARGARQRALTHASWAERADRLLRAARLPRRQRPRPRRRLRALSSASPTVDAGGLTKIHNQAVSGVSCAEVGRELGVPEMLRAAEPEAEPAIPAEVLLGGARRAARGDRGADRRLLPRLRLRAHRGGRGRRLRGADRGGRRVAGRLQVRPAGAARAAPGARKLRGDRRIGARRTSAPSKWRRSSIPSRSARGGAGARRWPSRRPPRRRWGSFAPEMRDCRRVRPGREP